jgi:hypothetical protein
MQKIRTFASERRSQEADPWGQVNVDLVGPCWTVQMPSRKCKSNALTWIDPTSTGCFQMFELPDKTMESILEAVNNTWLCQYPRPQMVHFDNGNEFKAEFM